MAVGPPAKLQARIRTFSPFFLNRASMCTGVSIGGFQGDWSLQIQDASGEVLSGADVNPPDYETAGVRLKKAATIIIAPCNMSGTPQAKVTYKYTYRK